MSELQPGDTLQYEASDGLQYEFTVAKVDEHNRTVVFQNGQEIDLAALCSGEFCISE